MATEKNHAFSNNRDPDRVCIYCGRNFGQTQYYLVCEKAPESEPKPALNIFERPFNPKRL